MNTHLNKKLIYIISSFVLILILIILAFIFFIDWTGEDTKNLIKQQELKNQYKQEISGAFNNYLAQRSLENFSKTDVCQQIINDTLNKVLEIVVPLEHKDIHLQAVILLEKEKGLCSTFSQKDFISLSQDWEELINSF